MAHMRTRLNVHQIAIVPIATAMTKILKCVLAVARMVSIVIATPASDAVILYVSASVKIVNT